MTTTISCSYSATATRQTTAEVSAAMSAVPIDLSIPEMVGLVPTGDSTATAGNVVTRTIILYMGTTQTYFGSVYIVVEGGAPAGPIVSIAVPSGIGGNFPAVPVLSVTDPTGSGAIAQVTDCSVGEQLALKGGSGYTSVPTATVVGGNNGDGVPATATCTISGGAVNSVTITNPGSGYTTFIEVEFTGGGGSGASAYFGIKPTAVTVTDGGSSYTAPTVTLTPLFTVSIPPTDDQTTPIQGWMQSLLQEALACPVTAAEPVVS